MLISMYKVPYTDNLSPVALQTPGGGVIGSVWVLQMVFPVVQNE